MTNKWPLGIPKTGYRDQAREDVTGGKEVCLWEDREE
jgi:hypothetical protein